MHYDNSITQNTAIVNDVHNREATREEMEVFAAKKKDTLPASKRMLAIGEVQRAYRMEHCADNIALQVCSKCGKRHITNAYLCRDRFCPLCAWRLARRRYAEMLQVTEHLQLNQYDAYFVTLTIKNCKGENLADTLSLMATAINRVWARRTIKRAVAGWARSVEVTYNATTHTHHPHYHMIILQPIGGLGMTTREWSQIWRECLGVDYDVICDCRKIQLVNDKSTGDVQLAAVLETYKYTIKQSDVADMPLSDYRYLVHAMRGRRLASYGGVIKKARQQLGLKDDDTAMSDINEQEISCKNCDGEMLQAIAKWSITAQAYDITIIDRSIDDDKG